MKLYDVCEWRSCVMYGRGVNIWFGFFRFQLHGEKKSESTFVGSKNNRAVSRVFIMPIPNARSYFNPTIKQERLVRKRDNERNYFHPKNLLFPFLISTVTKTSS